MPVMNGSKFSCEPCIRGHRAISCQHRDRVLVEVRKPGRPMQSCGHTISACVCGRLNQAFQLDVKQDSNQSTPEQPEPIIAASPAIKRPSPRLPKTSKRERTKSKSESTLRRHSHSKRRPKSQLTSSIPSRSPSVPEDESPSLPQQEQPTQCPTPEIGVAAPQTQRSPHTANSTSTQSLPSISPLLEYAPSHPPNHNYIPTSAPQHLPMLCRYAVQTGRASSQIEDLSVKAYLQGQEQESVQWGMARARSSFVWS